jgi:subtilisin family serine protease
MVAAANAQYPTYSTVDSLPEFNLNWYNHSPDNTKISGVAVEKAYNELLKGKSPKKKIIVAVIDSGVDTDHEDLAGNIWVNEDEIPDNGIDDDKNGYIDDINGWNFLGGADGSMITNESLEMTRIVRDFGSKFEGKSLGSIPSSERENYKMYVKAKEELDAKVEMYERQKQMFGKVTDQYKFSVKLLQTALQNENFTDEELEAFETEDADMLRAKAMVKEFRSTGLDKVLVEMMDHIDENLDYNLNVEFDAREAAGDDIYDINDRDYGNNNVEGDEADH